MPWLKKTPSWRRRSELVLLQSAVEEFGQRLGMPLAIGREGVTALDISDVGRLYLEISALNGREELLAYLTRPVPTHDQGVARRALTVCHYCQGGGLPLWAGVHGDNLVVLTRFSEREATGQALENAAIFLAESLNRILEGGM